MPVPVVGAASSRPCRTAGITRPTVCGALRRSARARQKSPACPGGHIGRPYGVPSTWSVGRRWGGNRGPYACFPARSLVSMDLRKTTRRSKRYSRTKLDTILRMVTRYSFHRRVSAQIAAQQRGGRGEDAVEAEDLGHGLGDVIGRLEGIAAVQGEVPHHRQHQGNQIAGPVGPPHQLIEQGEGHDLDDPRRQGKAQKFQRADQFLSFSSILLRAAQQPEALPVVPVQALEYG